MIEKVRDLGFDFESLFGWGMHLRCAAIATESFRESDNGNDKVIHTLENGTKENYHETYSEVEFLANETSQNNFCYLELATNVYPLLLRLFPVVDGSSPIGGRHDTIGTSFQKLSPQEQNEQAPIIARGFISWFIACQRRTGEEVEDYDSDMDDRELDFMRGYYIDMQERNICWLHNGRRWKGKDLTTPFEDEHLKTETEYYEQAKVNLPKYLGEHHPRLVEYALDFGQDYLEFVKETIAKRRAYTEEQATAHRQGDKPTEGTQAASSMASHKMFPVAEAESDSKLEDAVNMICRYFENDKNKAREYLIITKGKTETEGGRQYCRAEPETSKDYGNPFGVFKGFCFYNDIVIKDEEERKRRYKRRFARGIWETRKQR